MVKNFRLYDYVREDGMACPVCGHPIKDMKCKHCNYPYNPVDSDGDNINITWDGKTVIE